MQTRMPTVFYTVDGIPKVDHPEQEIEAIAAYLLQMNEAPETTAAEIEAEREADLDARQTDWITEKY